MTELERYEAATELVRAVDTVTLLEQVEQVVPGAFPVTEPDRERVRQAAARLDGRRVGRRRK